MTQQQPEPAGTSRRKVILTGAGLAAAGVVVGAGVPLATSRMASGDTEAGEPVAAPSEPVMVHLRDAASGHFDAFVGTRRIQFTDHAFASRLSAVVTKAEGK
jgi:hypothetical protein